MAEPARHLRAVEDSSAWEIALPDEAATLALGRYLADELRPGDVLALSGGLGSGKTTLARAIVRALAGEDALEVPSPTFTLMQGYDTPRGTALHTDLYRIGNAEELRELGFDEAAEGAITLVEWPERAASALNPNRFQIALDLAGPEGARKARLTASGALTSRLT